jgi:hypothetical protein
MTPNQHNSRKAKIINKNNNLSLDRKNETRYTFSQLFLNREINNEGG